MSFLQNKTVLVTGAGGSIGSELCRQVMQQSPKKLVLFDSSELALYNIDRELGGKAEPVLGDVANDKDVHSLFFRDNFDVVYHTAAYKHVTLCEKNPRVAWRVNVDGTRLVAGVARDYSVPTLVLVSTDKAVEPSSVMGSTKQAAERIVMNLGYTVIRLGNVACSSGSVIPLWEEQIKQKEPVTITHPSATRYFITGRRAAKAIIEASMCPTPSRTYIAPMGKPRPIIEIAKAMGAHEFKVIGLRPGEKLHEQLTVGTPDEVQL